MVLHSRGCGRVARRRIQRWRILRSSPVAGFPEDPLLLFARGSRRASAPGTLFLFLSRFPFPAARGRLLFRLAGSGSSGRALRGVPGRGFFRIRAGCLPPPIGVFWTLEGLSAGGSLHPLGVLFRWEARGREDCSSEWMDLDAGKPANVPIPPVIGGFETFGGQSAGAFLQ